MTSEAAKRVTPVVLTYNEEPNIGRTLESLRWASQVIVLDSGSTDQTEQIVRSFPNVSWLVRPFDKHLAQWEHGLHQSGITTDYVLALDADMQVTAPLLQEIEGHFLSGDFAGGVIPFAYHYYGKALSGSLCPPQLRLFNRLAVRLAQPDHTQRFSVAGDIYKFRNSLIHDDRKSVDRWVASQLAYQLLNEQELANGGRRRMRDRLRHLGVMPPIVGLLAYVRAGGPFRGAAAARYAYERSVAEGLLAIRLMDARLKRGGDHSLPAPEQSNGSKKKFDS
ncbi:MAG TPA: glycosyltransferase family 2 protein [Pyrinomonadaceae bacterium]|jgi:glycosyltransferase involved in cell wall biosynthesis|nr:glycosyltransferase family 2 protein [Pyrinomonadaceae bacterium]